MWDMSKWEGLFQAVVHFYLFVCFLPAQLKEWRCHQLRWERLGGWNRVYFGREHQTNLKSQGGHSWPPSLGCTPTATLSILRPAAFFHSMDRGESAWLTVPHPHPWPGRGGEQGTSLTVSLRTHSMETPRRNEGEWEGMEPEWVNKNRCSHYTNYKQKINHSLSTYFFWKSGTAVGTIHIFPSPSGI